MPEDDSIKLIERCAEYASRHGINEMLDLIADIHLAYAPLSTDFAVKAAYELAGVNLDGALPLQ